MPNRARSTINLLAAATLGLLSAALPAVAFAQSASEGASSAPVTSGNQETATGSPAQAPIAEGRTAGSAPIHMGTSM